MNTEAFQAQNLLMKKYKIRKKKKKILKFLKRNRKIIMKTLSEKKREKD